MIRLLNKKNIKVIGFDLDDTLHYYKKASQKSIEKLLRKIAKRYDVPLGTLRVSYSKILSNMQKHHFILNQPSRMYRKTRFELLLKTFQLPINQVDWTLDEYDSLLKVNLKLKKGAIEVLHQAKSIGLKVVVVSEGPQDAQVLTIERLGISKYIDQVFTSDYYQMSKTEGLFELVLNQLKCKPQEMIFIGDNRERDYKPSKALGINALYLTNNAISSKLENSINSLEEVLL